MGAGRGRGSDDGGKKDEMEVSGKIKIKKRGKAVILTNRRVWIEENGVEVGYGGGKVIEVRRQRRKTIRSKSLGERRGRI